MARIVRPEIRALSAYRVAPVGERVKLDAMENPYGLPPELRRQWLATLSDAPLNRYPDAAAQALKERLRGAFEIPGAASILLGNGSDEIIQMIVAAVDGPVMAPAPSFVMYEMAARYVNKGFVEVPLDRDFNLDTHAMLAALKRDRPAVVFIAYPNNPTGTLFREADLRCIIEAAPGLVVIDEAYHAFADRSLMRFIQSCPNLLVMRTLSKLGLAGLRFGFAVAHPAWIEQLEKLRLPYNVGVLTQLSVTFALDHLAVFERQADRIREQRQRVADALGDAGYRCFPSAANFILFHCGARSATDVFQALLNGGVLVKNLSDAQPALVGCLRVSIGTPEENERFLAALPR